MECSSCGFENPQGMRFCGACGATLRFACAGCGVVNPVNFKFCGGCGATLAESDKRGVRVHTAHCVAHGKMVPFLPMLELMRDFFGLTEQDSDEAARRKIAGTLLLLDQALTDALPLVFDFLGVTDPADPPLRMDPEARQRRLFALVKRIGQARSRREPTLLLWEDLHWIDDGSAPFLVTRAALARVLGDAATRRSELREAHRLFTEMDATARAEQVAKELAV